VNIFVSDINCGVFVFAMVFFVLWTVSLDCPFLIFVLPLLCSLTFIETCAHVKIEEILKDNFLRVNAHLGTYTYF
jgi:hypothetical protein